MKVVICMPTGDDGIRDDAVIRDALLTAVNRTFTPDELKKLAESEVA